MTAVGVHLLDAAVDVHPPGPGPHRRTGLGDPVTDTATLADLTRTQREGFITNTTLGRDIDHKESLSGLARIRFRPTATTEITFLGTGPILSVDALGMKSIG